MKKTIRNILLGTGSILALFVLIPWILCGFAYFVAYVVVYVEWVMSVCL